MEPGSHNKKLATNRIFQPSQSIKSARVVHKSQTTTDLNRPFSSKPKEIYTLTRLLPKNIKEDKEKLYEENMRLKVHAHQIMTQNLYLGTRVKNLENKKRKVEESDPGLSLIAMLKANVRELTEKIEEKDEEIASLRRNVRSSKLKELEAEINIYQEECTRLSSLLNEFMKQKNILPSQLEYENRIYINGEQIFRLRKDLQESQSKLIQAKDEVVHLRERVSKLEKKTHQHSTNSLELNIIKDEYESLKTTSSKAQIEFFEKEAKLKEEVRELKDQIDKETSRYKNLERDYEERLSLLESLKKQVSFIRSENVRANDYISMPESPITVHIKNKNPPRLFRKMIEVTRERSLMISVFLTLLDKNNNGLIEIEEIKKGCFLHGRPIKIKHVNEALRIMNIQDKVIPLKLIEQYIDKYEYEDDYSSSSEEEAVIQTKIRIKS